MLELTGLHVSVYSRVVRMVLAAKGLTFAWHDADPFATPPDPALARLTPFLRVPVLSHDGFTLYETAAIARYLDAAFQGPALVPPAPQPAARMAQVIGIADAYGYWPMVRQVFSHRIFAPLEGHTPEEAEIAAGLAASGRVLGALETIAAEGLQLNRARLTLADLHLAPMVDYFQRAPEGHAMLAAHPALSAWFDWIAQQPAFTTTAIHLPPHVG